eukprot:2029790-Rhodomonas_salina.5
MPEKKCSPTMLHLQVAVYYYAVILCCSTNRENEAMLLPVLAYAMMLPRSGTDLRYAATRSKLESTSTLWFASLFARCASILRPLLLMVTIHSIIAPIRSSIAPNYSDRAPVYHGNAHTDGARTAQVPTGKVTLAVGSCVTSFTKTPKSLAGEGQIEPGANRCATAIGLRACYELSGTDKAYDVLSTYARVLRACYGYGADCLRTCCATR